MIVALQDRVGYLEGEEILSLERCLVELERRIPLPAVPVVINLIDDDDQTVVSVSRLLSLWQQTLCFRPSLALNQRLTHLPKAPVDFAKVAKVCEGFAKVVKVCDSFDWFAIVSIGLR